MKEEVEIWLARDLNNDLYIYKEKPNKGMNGWLDGEECLFLNEIAFPSVKWKDKEPTKAKIILNK